MPENTAPTAAEMDAMLPAFREALAKSQRAACAKDAGALASEIARNASRMKYLAMAADCIADGSGLPEPDQGNCVGFLLDTLQYLGAVSADAADRLEFAVRQAFEGVQA